MIGYICALDDTVASMPAHRHAKTVEPVASPVVVGVEEAHQLDQIIGGQRTPVSVDQRVCAVQGAFAGLDALAREIVASAGDDRGDIQGLVLAMSFGGARQVAPEYFRHRFEDSRGVRSIKRSVAGGRGVDEGQ